MCNVNCILFGARNLRGEEICEKKILEVGSRDVSGSLRSFVLSRKPERYIGIDIVDGPGVDLTCDAENLLAKFEEESFDIVISTELLEHVRNWRKVIHNIKDVCKPGGIILITTRSVGFPYHGWPYDFWRYEPEDMEKIFSDCEIQALEKDPQCGVFLKVRKPHNFEHKDLSGIELYSIVSNRRTSEIRDEDLRSCHFRKLVWKSKAGKLIRKAGEKIFRLI
jgi:SAM-dependent methyltransferase